MHTVISQITDGVLDDVRAWQSRPLDAIYPIVWLDGIVVKMHHGKQVSNQSAHVVLGVNLNRLLKYPQRPTTGLPAVNIDPNSLPSQSPFMRGPDTFTESLFGYSGAS